MRFAGGFSPDGQRQGQGAIASHAPSRGPAGGQKMGVCHFWYSPVHRFLGAGVFTKMQGNGARPRLKSRCFLAYKKKTPCFQRV